MERQLYLKYKSNEQAKQQTRTVDNKLTGHEVLRSPIQAELQLLS